MHNRLTSPYTYHDDHGHAIRRKAARKVRAYIRRHVADLVRETDSGHLYVANPYR
jgi:hypothetical protein